MQNLAKKSDGGSLILLIHTCINHYKSADAI